MKKLWLLALLAAPATALATPFHCKCNDQGVTVDAASVRAAYLKAKKERCDGKFSEEEMKKVKIRCQRSGTPPSK